MLLAVRRMLIDARVSNVIEPDATRSWRKRVARLQNDRA